MGRLLIITEHDGCFVVYEYLSTLLKIINVSLRFKANDNAMATKGSFVNKKHKDLHIPIVLHQAEMSRCDICPEMIGPVITCQPVRSKIMLIGQAPGDREGVIGRPFGWTAGKTLFKWFASQGVNEETFRDSVYIASVCRCFPGKNPRGGDRVPKRDEIAACRQWMEKEFELLQPNLIILVGKLAISQFLTVKKLTDVVGHQFQQEIAGQMCTLIPLPHPSGASTWHQSEPGSLLLQKALAQLGNHDEWQLIK